MNKTTLNFNATADAEIFVILLHKVVVKTLNTGNLSISGSQDGWSACTVSVIMLLMGS